MPTAQTRTASATGVMALSEAFFEPLVAGAGPVLLTLLFPPPSSFVLPSFAWFYIFFSSAR